MLSHLIKPIDRLDQQSLDCDSLNAHDGFSSDDDDDDDDGLSTTGVKPYWNCSIY